jgi:predicted RND superfamily exporter protein
MFYTYGFSAKKTSGFGVIKNLGLFCFSGVVVVALERILMGLLPAFGHETEAADQQNEQGEASAP